jgi:hypothetical protein
MSISNPPVHSAGGGFALYFTQYFGIVKAEILISQENSMKRMHLIIVIFVCLWAVVCAADKEKGKKTQSDKADKTEKKELKLEDLLPEKSLFGPSASGMAFSRDGKYAAYLYRPYKERRHGSDLYIYDVEKGKARRVTWPSVMAKFQKSSRKVIEDRIEKAKKEKPSEEDEKKENDKAKDDKDKDKEQKKNKDKKAKGQKGRTSRQIRQGRG